MAVAAISVETVSEAAIPVESVAVAAISEGAAAVAAISVEGFSFVVLGVCLCFERVIFPLSRENWHKMLSSIHL